MVQPRIHPPPPPSTPKEAPWREIEEIIEGLNSVAEKLGQIISAISGLPPGAIPAPPALAPIVDKLDTLISGIVTNKLTFLTGQKDVATAGTPEQLVKEDEDVLVPAGFKVTIIAKPGNSGTVYLGRTKADCVNTARRFDGLSAGLAHSLKIDRLSKVWVDVDNNGEGVSWIVEQ